MKASSRSWIKNNLKSQKTSKGSKKSNEIFDDDEDDGDGDKNDNNSKMANLNSSYNESLGFLVDDKVISSKLTKTKDKNKSKARNENICLKHSKEKTMLEDSETYEDDATLGSERKSNCSELETNDDPNEFPDNNSENETFLGSDTKVKKMSDLMRMTNKEKVSVEWVNVYDDDNEVVMDINHRNLVKVEGFDIANCLLPYHTNGNNMVPQSKTSNKKEIRQKGNNQQPQTPTEKKSNDIKNIEISNRSEENDDIYDDDDNMNPLAHQVDNMNDFQNNHLKGKDLIKTIENSSRDLKSSSFSKRFKSYTKQLKTQVQQIKETVSKQTLEKSKDVKPEKKIFDMTLKENVDEIYDEELESEDHEREEVNVEDKNINNNKVKDDQISERSFHNEIHSSHATNIQGQIPSEKSKRFLNVNSTKTILKKENNTLHLNQNNSKPKINTEKHSCKEILNINKDLRENEHNTIHDDGEIYDDDINEIDNDKEHDGTCEEIPKDDLHEHSSKDDIQNQDLLPKKEKKSSFSLDSMSPTLMKNFQFLQKKTKKFKSKIKNQVKNFQHQCNVKEKCNPCNNDEVYDEDMEKELHKENNQNMPVIEEIYDDDDNSILQENLDNFNKLDHEEVYDDDDNQNNDDQASEIISFKDNESKQSNSELQGPTPMKKKPKSFSSTMHFLDKKTSGIRSNIKNQVKQMQFRSHIINERSANTDNEMQDQCKAEKENTVFGNEEVYDEDMESEIHIGNNQRIPEIKDQVMRLQLQSRLQVGNARPSEDNVEKIPLNMSSQNLIDTEEVCDDDGKNISTKIVKDNKNDDHEEVYDDDENENNSHDNTDTISGTISQNDIHSTISNEDSQNRRPSSKDKKPFFRLDAISPTVNRNIQFLQNKTTKFKSKLKNQVKNFQHQCNVKEKCNPCNNDEVYDEDMEKKLHKENNQNMPVTEEIYDDDDNSILQENLDNFNKLDHEEVYDDDDNQNNDDQASEIISFKDNESKQSNSELQGPTPMKKKPKSFSSTMHFLDKKTSGIRSNIKNQVKQMQFRSHMINERSANKDNEMQDQCKAEKENTVFGNDEVYDEDMESETPKKKIQNLSEDDDVYDDDNENVSCNDTTENIPIHDYDEVYEDNDHENNSNDNIKKIPKDYENECLPSKIKKSSVCSNPDVSLLKKPSKYNLNLKDQMKNLISKVDKSKSPLIKDELYDDDDNMDDNSLNKDQSYEVISLQDIYDEDSNDGKNDNSKTFDQVSQASSKDKKKSQNNCQPSSVSPPIQKKKEQMKMTIKSKFQNIKNVTKKPILFEKINKDKENLNDEIYDDDEKDESNEENNENTKQPIKTKLICETEKTFPNCDLHENISNKDSGKKEKKAFNFNIEKKLSTIKTNLKDQVKNFQSDSKQRKELENDHGKEIEEIKKSEICENEDIYDDDENVDNDHEKTDQKSERKSENAVKDNKLNLDLKSPNKSPESKIFSLDLNSISPLFDKNILYLTKKTSKLKVKLKGQLKLSKPLSKTKNENAPFVNTEIYDVDDDDNNTERSLCDSEIASMTNVSDPAKNSEDPCQESTDHSSQGSLQIPKQISKENVNVSSEMVKVKKNIIDRNLKVFKEKTRSMAKNIKTQVQTFKESSWTNKTNQDGDKENLGSKVKENDDIYDDDENCNDVSQSLDLEVISEQDIYDDDSDDIKDETLETVDQDSLASFNVEMKNQKNIKKPLMSPLAFIQKKKDSLRTNIKSFTKVKNSKRTSEKTRNVNCDLNEEVYDDDENSERLKDSDDNASGSQNNDSAEIYDDDETQIDIPKIQKHTYQNRKQLKKLNRMNVSSLEKAEEKGLDNDSEEEVFDNSESEHSIDMKYIKNQFNNFSSKLHSKLKKKMIKLNQKSKQYFQKDENVENGFLKLPDSFDDEPDQMESESLIEDQGTRSFSGDDNEITLTATSSYYDRKLETLLNLKRKIHKQISTSEHAKNNKGKTEGHPKGNVSKKIEPKFDVFDDIYDEDSDNEGSNTMPIPSQVSNIQIQEQNDKSQNEMNPQNLEDKESNKEFNETIELKTTAGLAVSNVKDTIDKDVSRKICQSNNTDNPTHSKEIQLPDFIENHNETIKEKFIETESFRKSKEFSNTEFPSLSSDQEFQKISVQDLLIEHRSLGEGRGPQEISADGTIYPTKQPKSSFTINKSDICPPRPPKPKHLIGNTECQSQPDSIEEVTPKISLSIRERIKNHENILNLQ